MNSIGVIVPVYNVKEEYLRECLDSLLDQTYKNIHIYIVDDKSQDWCSHLCDEIGKNDERITVIHNDVNKGVSESRNVAIRLCDTDWICFVDGDDWIDRDTCECFIKYVSNNKAPDVYMLSGYRSYPNHEEGNKNDFSLRIYETREEIDKLQINSLTTFLIDRPDNTIPYDSPCAKFFRTELIKQNDLFFKRIPFREDAIYFQEVLQHSKRVVEVPDLHYHYRMRADSAVNIYRKDAKKELMDYLDLLWAFAKASHKGKEYDQALYGAGFFAMQTLITNYYYNKENKDNWLMRRKDCTRLFKNHYFAGVVKAFPLKTIKRNHRIKMVLLRIRWYSGLSILRSVYLRVHKRECFE